MISMRQIPRTLFRYLIIYRNQTETEKQISHDIYVAALCCIKVCTVTTKV